MLAADGQAPLGSWIMSASPLVAEAMGHAGFAWSVVDMEHSPLDFLGLAQVLQAVQSVSVHGGASTTHR